MEHLSGLVDFSGKVVLVTGASRGIGRAIALVFARAGAKVALAARSADKLEEVAGEVCAVGGEALVLSVDVAVEAEVNQAIETVVAKWERFPTYGAHLTRYFFQLIRRSCSKRHLRPRPRKNQRDRPPDAPAGPGDQNHLTRKIY
jgi:short-subunit dehydrogenase